jgi:hypothetical protein
VVFPRLRRNCRIGFSNGRNRIRGSHGKHQGDSISRQAILLKSTSHGGPARGEWREIQPLPTLINVFRAAVNSTFFEQYADRRGLTTRARVF